MGIEAEFLICYCSSTIKAPSNADVPKGCLSCHNDVHDQRRNFSHAKEGGGCTSQKHYSIKMFLWKCLLE